MRNPVTTCCGMPAQGASVLQLGNTYRLQPPMLQAANSLIARNRGRVTKPPSEVSFYWACLFRLISNVNSLWCL
jgi:hypothetical protein